MCGCVSLLQDVVLETPILGETTTEVVLNSLPGVYMFMVRFC